jgi:hypothetical protein
MCSPLKGTTRPKHMTQQNDDEQRIQEYDT